MPNYKKLYFKLFNDMTDVIEKLKTAQQEAEEMYLDQCEDDNPLLMVGQPPIDPLPSKEQIASSAQKAGKKKNEKSPTI